MTHPALPPLPAMPYISEREAYGRHVRYDTQIATCDLCGQNKTCLAVDTSDEEYCVAYVCADCCSGASRAHSQEIKPMTAPIPSDPLEASGPTGVPCGEAASGNTSANTGLDAPMLEHSYAMTIYSEPGSRLEFLSDFIFDFTTYDSKMSELFARKALEVCAAINARTTFDYIENPENYRWYLLMVNMPFFAGRLDWGTSIRGAWWDNGEQTLESCGLWRGAEQVLSLKMQFAEWLQFIDALIAFAAESEKAPGPKPGGT